MGMFIVATDLGYRQGDANDVSRFGSVVPIQSESASHIGCGNDSVMDHSSACYTV